MAVKSLEVLVILVEAIVNGISHNKSKENQKIFHLIRHKIEKDLEEVSRVRLPNEGKKGLGLLTIIRLIGVLSPLYLEFQGPKVYQNLFQYIIFRSTKKMLK